MNDNKPSLLKIYFQLMKLRVVILLQITAICAILAHDLMVRNNAITGDRTWYDTGFACLITVVGGTLAAGGSNAINMVYDRDIDPGMSRTRTRPIPNGWISPNHALIFGIIIAIGGSALFLLANWKAAFWSIFSVLFYVFVYTIWLKRRTPQNIVIGGIAGSTPPLIGWIVAASENIPNNLTPDTIRIYVIGEVSSPGMITVDSKTRISQAILIAGGPRNWRYQDKINLLRVNRNGFVEVKKISFNKEGLSANAKKISLRDGDIIRVNKNLFGKSSDALGTFLPPIRDMYSLYGVYKLIEQ